MPSLWIICSANTYMKQACRFLFTQTAAQLLFKYCFAESVTSDSMQFLKEFGISACSIFCTHSPCPVILQNGRSIPLLHH